MLKINHKFKNDSLLMVRETSPRKIREHCAKVRLRTYEIFLQQDLTREHIEEHFDQNSVPVPPSFKKTVWLKRKIEQFNLYCCIFFHQSLVYHRGDQYSTCSVCKRKYALPWADHSKLDADVYISSDVFIKPLTPTRQTLCMNGTQGKS